MALHEQPAFHKALLKHNEDRQRDPIGLSEETTEEESARSVHVWEWVVVCYIVYTWA